MKKLGKLLFITSLLLCFLIPRGWTQTQAKNQPDSIELKLKEIYTKREVMIPCVTESSFTPLSTNRKTTAGSILS